jgi:hypothetical protein
VSLIRCKLHSLFHSKKIKPTLSLNLFFLHLPKSRITFLFSHTIAQTFFFIHPHQFHIHTQPKPTKKDKLLLVEEIPKAREVLLRYWSYIHRRLLLAVHAPRVKSEHHEFHSLLCRPVSLMLWNLGLCEFVAMWFVNMRFCELLVLRLGDRV